MPNNKRFFAVFFTIALILSMSGCAARVAHVTDLPTGVTEQQAKNWDAAIADLHKIADLNSTLRKAVIIIRNDGLFTSDEYYTKALTAVGRIDQYELESVNYLQQQPKLFSESQRQKLQSEMGLISDEISTLVMINATGIKNEGSKTTVGQIIGEITAVANLILALKL